MSESRGRRWPAWMADLVLGAGVGLATLVSVVGWWMPHDAGARPFDALGGVLVGLVTAGVALRGGGGLVAFALVEVGSLAWILLGYEGVVVLVALAIGCYTLTTVRGAWWGGGAAAVNVVAGAMAILARVQDAGSEETLAAWAGVSVVAVVAGLAVRSYRAYAAMLREQVRRAEQDREAEASRRVDLERLRIARELHDVVSHTIATINVQASTAAYVAGRQPAADPETTAALTAIKQASGDALRDLRAMLGMLRRAGDDDDPTALQPAPGLDQLDALAEETRAAGVAVEVVSCGPPRTLPSPLQHAAYRIVQESLTNVRRHAAARHATVTLTYEPDRLQVAVTDDGRGPTGPAPGPGGAGAGFGLTGMRERAEALGGELEAGPADGGGFQVRCRLPVPVEERA